MKLARISKHLLMPPWRVRTVFTAHSLRTIETAIRECEAKHSGEIRFAVESALSFFPLMRNQPVYERALEVFSQLRVWDTESNNGVLIYLLLADRDVEIIADRHIHQNVPRKEWERICHNMEAMFRLGKFESGVIAGIHAIGAHLAKHYPKRRDDKNELADTSAML